MTILSFDIDPRGVTLLRLQVGLLRDQNMFENLLDTLRTDLPTHSLHVSLQIHPDNDYNADERFAHLQDSLQNVEGIQIARVPYQENDLENDQENGQEDGQENVQENDSSFGNYLKKAGFIGAGAIAGAIAGPFAAITGAAALGFTTTGIAAGSIATGIMSSYGGAVTAGSLCAVMQSIGAAGLGVAGTTIASTVGAIVGGISSKLFSS